MQVTESQKTGERSIVLGSKQPQVNNIFRLQGPHSVAFVHMGPQGLEVGVLGSGVWDQVLPG